MQFNVSECFRCLFWFFLALFRGAFCFQSTRFEVLPLECSKIDSDTLYGFYRMIDSSVPVAFVVSHTIIFVKLVFKV